MSDQELTDKLAAAMQREALAARAELETLSFASGTHLVKSAERATRTHLRLFLLAGAFAEHTEIAKTRKDILGDLLENLPELAPLLEELLDD